MTDDEVADRLLDALNGLQQIAGALTAEQAARALDEASIEVFWRDWPDVSSWTGALWRTIDEDHAGPAREAEDPEFDEVGGGD
ncbi:MAG: hypothetical protein ACT4PI_12870 [Actinomycetota bacterium]